MGCGCGGSGRRNVLPPPTSRMTSPDKLLPVLIGPDNKAIVPQALIPHDRKRHIERLRRDKILKHIGKPLAL
jgi:hypothetical protein